VVCPHAASKPLERRWRFRTPVAKSFEIGRRLQEIDDVRLLIGVMAVKQFRWLSVRLLC